MFDVEIEVWKFDEAIKPAYVWSEDCVFDISPAGIRILARGPADIATMRTFLKSDAFEEYEVNGGKIGMKLNKLEGIVKSAKKQNRIDAKITESRRLWIEVRGQEYDIAPYDPSTVQTGPDSFNIDYSAEITIEREDLDQAVSAAKMISEYAEDIEFTTDGQDESLTLTTEGDSDRTERVMGKEEVIEIEPGDASSRFRIDQLSKLVRAIPDNADVHLKLSDDRPMKINWELSEDNGEVSMYIAPRLA